MNNNRSGLNVWLTSLISASWLACIRWLASNLQPGMVGSARSLNVRLRFLFLLFLLVVSASRADDISYAYDSLERVAQAANAISGQAAVYSYDAAGNTLTQNIVALSTISISGFSPTRGADGQFRRHCWCRIWCDTQCEHGGGRTAWRRTCNRMELASAGIS